jgi:hypothetical protein
VVNIWVPGEMLKLRDMVIDSGNTVLVNVLISGQSIRSNV